MSRIAPCGGQVEVVVPGSGPISIIGAVGRAEMEWRSRAAGSPVFHAAVLERWQAVQ
ncbi:hypothetical protein [Nocardia carnea]|uniref:hypothetical protein n=1 Tax=Nocardia carnea TaxID=37328 RepID=UPI002454C0A7|nr:hypothetical protein [Nocardia carnea]